MKNLVWLGSKKIWFWIGGGVLAVPFVLAHAAVLIMKLSEPKLSDVDKQFVKTEQGFTLTVYKRPNTNVDNTAATIVFVHGSPGSADAYHAQFSKPQKNCDLIAYDRPGYGAPPPPGKGYNLATQTAALVDLLKASHITNYILVGHSYGGPVVLKTAIEHPELVRGVVLIGGSIDPSQEKTMWVQMVANLPGIRSLLPRDLRVCNTEILALKTDLMTLQKEIPLLQRPVLMLHGTKDPLVPVANVAYLENQLSTAGKSALFNKMLMEGYNHFIPWEHPEAVSAAIDLILKKSAAEK